MEKARDVSNRGNVQICLLITLHQVGGRIRNVSHGEQKTMLPKGLGLGTIMLS